jgi:hypothetical protein
VQLVAPGKIVHLVKALSDDSLSSRRWDGYKAVWAPQEDFSEVHITTSILSDHSRIFKELEDVAESLGLKPPYFFPD